MTGSASASLTGLMFVVVTLVAGERMRRNPDGIKVFSTPTVAHYGAALLFSAILIAPWRASSHAAVLLGLGALCGIGYMLRILHRTRGLSQYTPDLEDWIWYTARTAYCVRCNSCRSGTGVPGIQALGRSRWRPG